METIGSSHWAVLWHDDAERRSQSFATKELGGKDLMFALPF